MDTLDRLIGHDVYTTRLLLEVADGLTDEQLDHVFPFGQGTLRQTFEHLIGNMEVWLDFMQFSPQPSTLPLDKRNRMPMLRARFERIAIEYAALATRLRDAGRLDECFTDHFDMPVRKKRFGTALVHLATHSMHHRAQILAMMDMLGVPDLPEGDVFSWERAVGEQPEQDS
jgi:uncharacterized damage-inducible protein DinB